jgi:stage V sporulation protein G
MQITSVNVKKYDKEESKMKGIASVLIDDCFVIRDIRIIEGNDGLFIAMPSRRKNDGEYQDVAHPINAETRKMFEDAIFEEYNKAEVEE